MKRKDFLTLLNLTVKDYSNMRANATPEQKAAGAVRRIMPFACENGEEIVKPIAGRIVLILRAQSEGDTLTVLELVEDVWDLYTNSMVGKEHRTQGARQGINFASILQK